MKVKLLDENTYGLYDGEVQVKQAPITAEIREAAKAKKYSISRYIGQVVEKVEVEVPLPAAEVGTEAVYHVPPHEHDIDERYALAEHEHDYQKPGELTPHKHDDFKVLAEAVENIDRSTGSAVNGLHKRLDTHQHAEYALAFHTHDDIYATLNVLRGMITAVEASIPRETQPHTHNDSADAIAVLRSEMTSLRAAIDREESKRAEMADAVRSLIDTRIAEAAPKGDYVTRDEWQSNLPRTGKGEWKVLSEQNVDGKRRMTVEEVSG